jgi:hypothetical protein
VYVRREEAAEMCRVCSHVREPGLQPPPLWPWWLSVQCAFHSGDLKSVRADARLALPLFCHVSEQRL